MGRDSILDESERNRQQNDDESEPEPTENASDGDDNERVRLTQRMTPELAAKVDAVQDRYQLPSRNATINFILIEGIDSLLEEDQDR